MANEIAPVRDFHTRNLTKASTHLDMLEVLHLPKVSQNNVKLAPVDKKCRA